MLNAMSYIEPSRSSLGRSIPRSHDDLASEADAVSNAHLLAMLSSPQRSEIAVLLTGHFSLAQMTEEGRQVNYTKGLWWAT